VRRFGMVTIAFSDAAATKRDELTERFDAKGE